MNCFNKILFVAILLIAGFLCFGTEPNNAVNSDYRSIEARLTALEERLDAIEERLSRLESRRPVTAPRQPNPVPQIPEDSNKDAQRIENVTQKIKKLKTEIQLADSRLADLSTQKYLNSMDKLRIIAEQRKLLYEKMADYKEIIRLGEKNPDLGVSIITTKQSLMDCQSLMKTLEVNEMAINDAIRQKPRQE